MFLTGKQPPSTENYELQSSVLPEIADEQQTDITPSFFRKTRELVARCVKRPMPLDSESFASLGELERSMLHHLAHSTISEHQRRKLEHGLTFVRTNTPQDISWMAPRWLGQIVRRDLMS